jgi:hypothetical protein
MPEQPGEELRRFAALAIAVQRAASSAYGVAWIAVGRVGGWVLRARGAQDAFNGPCTQPQRQLGSVKCCAGRVGPPCQHARLGAGRGGGGGGGVGVGVVVWVRLRGGG